MRVAPITWLGVYGASMIASGHAVWGSVALLLVVLVEGFAGAAASEREKGDR